MTDTEQAAPSLAVGDVVRIKGGAGRARRETGIVRQVRPLPDIALVYWDTSGHRSWHRTSALVPTGERARQKGGAS